MPPQPRGKDETDKAFPDAAPVQAAYAHRAASGAKNSAAAAAQDDAHSFVQGLRQQLQHLHDDLPKESDAARDKTLLQSANEAPVPGLPSCDDTAGLPAQMQPTLVPEQPSKHHAEAVGSETSPMVPELPACRAERAAGVASATTPDDQHSLMPSGRACVQASPEFAALLAYGDTDEEPEDVDAHQRDQLPQTADVEVAGQQSAGADVQTDGTVLACDSLGGPVSGAHPPSEDTPVLEQQAHEPGADEACSWDTPRDQPKHASNGNEAAISNPQGRSPGHQNGLGVPGADLTVLSPLPASPPALGSSPLAVPDTQYSDIANAPTLLPSKAQPVSASQPAITALQRQSLKL